MESIPSLHQPPPRREYTRRANLALLRDSLLPPQWDSRPNPHLRALDQVTLPFWAQCPILKASKGPV